MVTRSVRSQSTGRSIVGEEGQNIFSNVSENKSSDRKLCLIPFVSAAPVVWTSHFEGFGDILTPYIGTGINGIPDPFDPFPPSMIF